MRIGSIILLAGLVAGGLPISIANAETVPGCPVFRWTTLGTAAGPVPTIDRSEPANLLEAGDDVLLVDAGDGAAVQLAKAGRQVGSVRYLFLSHLHWDHAGGLGAVIGLRWMNEYPGKLRIYGPPGTRAVVDGIVASLAAPARIGFGLGHLPPPPADSVEVVELSDGGSATLPGLTVRAAANSHYDPDPDKRMGTLSLSYRFEFGDRAITYTGDTGPSPAVAALAKGSDLLVSEVIALEPLIADIAAHRPDMTEMQRADMRRHLSTHHLDPGAAGAIAAAADVRQLVLTHFAIPGTLDANAVYLRAGVGREFRGRLELARDLARFDVPCRTGE